MKKWFFVVTLVVNGVLYDQKVYRAYSENGCNAIKAFVVAQAGGVASARASECRLDEEGETPEPNAHLP